MAYIYSQDDVERSRQQFSAFVRSEGIARLLSARLMAQQMGQPTDVIAIPQARMFSTMRSNQWLGVFMLSGNESAGVVRRGTSILAVPVLSSGNPTSPEPRFSSQLGDRGLAFLAAYRSMFELIGEPNAQFTLYAHRHSNSFNQPHHATDMPDIRIPSSLWGDPEGLTREMLRQTAPIYQFSYTHDVEGIIRNDERLFAPYAARVGMSHEDLNRLLRGVHSGTGIGIRNRIVSIVGHEFAHATVQPFPLVSTQTMERYARGEGSLSDILARTMVARGFLNEGQADMFSMAVSLDPMSTVAFRYYAGVRAMLTERKDPLPAGFKLGDPIRLRVIDPRTVESTDSPLYRMAERYARAFEQVVTDPSSTPYTGDLLADAAAAAFDVTKRQAYRQHLERSKLTGASGDLLPSMMGNFVRAQNSLADLVVRSMVQDYVSGAMDDLDDEDVKTVLRHQTSRFWSVGYVVGKARPDLIGKDLLVTPEEIRVADTGEQLDLGRIGLPELNIMSLDESPPQMHPVQLERAFKAMELYNRARDALRQGLKFAPQGGTAAEVVQSWREQMMRIMNR